ncbi:MAG: hypothetical protein WD225_03530 [Ilumatobacteraceae bacterium]
MTSWVVGAPGGGVSRPSGAPTCTGWSPAANISADAQPVDIGSIKVDPDGVVAVLYYRDCGDQRQFVWIRQEPPEVIASIALNDIRSRLLDQPVPDVSPATRGIVNLETWLAVSDPGEQSVTASIPGLSVTATASVTSVTWTVEGSAGAPIEIVCEGLGEPWTPADGEQPAPCGHTFTEPTDPDAPHIVEVRVVWGITWSASNGASGTLAPITSAAAQIVYPVDEIQTIGTRG